MLYPTLHVFMLDSMAYLQKYKYSLKKNSKSSSSAVVKSLCAEVDCVNAAATVH